MTRDEIFKLDGENLVKKLVEITRKHALAKGISPNEMEILREERISLEREVLERLKELEDFHKTSC